MFGGDGEDAGRAIALAASGDIAIGGQTDSSDFPVLRSFDQSLSGERATAYVRLTPISE